MSNSLWIRLMLSAVVVFAVVAVLVWFAFLRPTPLEQAAAVIVSKSHKPSGTYWQQQVGAERGFRSAIPITVAESYVLELRSEQLGANGFFSISPSDEGKYAIGQPVTMDYRRRGLPFVGYKITVFAVRPD